MFDVAIIGAGPAGSTAAIMLARLGYAVALLDKEWFPREKLCGDFVNPSNWPLLEDLGVERELFSRDHEAVTAFRVTSFNGAEAEAALPSIAGAAAYGLGMRRFFFDQILHNKAIDEGAASLQGCRIKRLHRYAGGWRVEFSRGENVEQLGATGRSIRSPKPRTALEADDVLVVALPAGRVAELEKNLKRSKFPGAEAG